MTQSTETDKSMVENSIDKKSEEKKQSNSEDEKPIEKLDDIQENAEKEVSIEKPIAENETKVPDNTQEKETQELSPETEATKADTTEASDKKKEEKAPEPTEDVEKETTPTPKPKENPKELIDWKDDDKPESAEINREELEAKYLSSSIEELVGFLDELVKNDDITKIKSSVALIKVAFRKKIKEEKAQKLQQFLDEGGDKKDYKAEPNPMEEKFAAAFEVYKSKKAKFIEEQEKLKQENLETKKQILEELKELINSEESLKKTYDSFKDLQEKWKNVGMVPRNEINNLWQSYHFLVEKFFDKVKINKELRDLDLKRNLENKIKLCEKTEELLLETSIIKSFKQLQKYHIKWKEMGPVAQEKKDEIWDRFKSATDKINQRRRNYYEKLEEEQSTNLSAKTALCEKIEEIQNIEIKTIKEWQKQTDKVNELFNIWKTVGTVPKENNEEIWNRFKSSMNTFYANKKVFYHALKEEQINNYNLKLDICAEAEALKDNTDWKNTTNRIIKLQQNWKEIGPVPRKSSDIIWKRFRAACDVFFNNKSDYFKNIEVHESNNLNEKREIIKKVKELEFGDNKNENLKIIKELQRDFTKIGHVPIKEKQNLQKEFRSTVENRLEELKISAVEISTLSFKSKFENIKSNPDGKKSIFKEKSFITGKINNLKSDITLWENNMGFFSNSKNADIVKNEFEKKIHKAKSDLLVFEAKLKYLNSI